MINKSTMTLIRNMESRFSGIPTRYNNTENREMRCRITGRMDCPYITDCSAFREIACRDELQPEEDYE